MTEDHTVDSKPLQCGVRYMIICFKCSRETKDLLDDLQGRAETRDYGELIHEALTAYRLLLSQAAETGALIVEVEGGRADERHDGPANCGTKPMGGARKRRGVPHVFARPGKALPGRQLPQRDETPDSIPVEEWLFGQFNKILPAKAACRALANLSLEQGPEISLTRASEIAQAAAHLGDELRRHDEAMGFSRDDRFATAFPEPGPNGDKSRQRFASQFVGYADQDGNVSGLPSGLKLIAAIPGAEEPSIGLTNAGWRFARLGNPALDALKERPTNRLSQEEAQFLIEHIIEHVPRERAAYCALLRAISNGHQTPSELDELAIDLASPGASERLSESFFSTQRSGAVSRMVDMGLVVRTRKGPRVIYDLTPTSMSFLDQCHPNSAD